ncbi:MAG: sensor histidine kinase [Bacteroidetes bacterium]|nr:sensor histidine kinase [Bacteroidota bacterium]
MPKSILKILFSAISLFIFSKTNAQDWNMNIEMFYSDSTAIVIENNYMQDKNGAKVQPLFVQMPFPKFYFDVYGPLIRISLFRMSELMRNGGFRHTGAFKDTLKKDASYFNIENLEYRISKKSATQNAWEPVRSSKKYISSYQTADSVYKRNGLLLYTDSLENGDTVHIYFRNATDSPFLNICFVKKDPLLSPPLLMLRKDNHQPDISIEKFVQSTIENYQIDKYQPFYQYRPGSSDEWSDRLFKDTKIAFVFRPRVDVANDSAFEYRLLVNGHSNTEWKKSDNIIYAYHFLPGNSYRMEVRYSDKPQFIYHYQFHVDALWYQTIWLKIAVAFIILVLVCLCYLFFRNRQRRRAYQQQLSRMNSIAAQLNPHFVFNALGSIQGLLNAGNIESANHYLSGFGKLLRHTLNDYEKATITLEQELKNLSNYIELEQLRKPFKFLWNIPDNLNTAEIRMLPLLFQPIIENAIKHFFNAEKPLIIEMNFLTEKMDMLITIMDNGSGFITNESISGKGLPLTKSRIELFNKISKSKKIGYQIESKKGGTSFHFKFINWLNED